MLSERVGRTERGIHAMIAEFFMKYLSRCKHHAPLWAHTFKIRKRLDGFLRVMHTPIAGTPIAKVLQDENRGGFSSVAPDSLFRKSCKPTSRIDDANAGATPLQHVNCLIESRPKQLDFGLLCDKTVTEDLSTT
jgi:hypothetical protein